MRTTRRLQTALTPLLQRARGAARYTSARSSGSAPRPGSGIDYYGAALVGADSIGTRALDARVLDDVTAELAALDPDDYTRYVAAFVDAGRRAGGAAWRYADITTVLAAATELLQPQSYLEIGVRRGRSMSIVARRAPGCDIVGVDLWNEGYAGIENPGEEHVRRVIEAAGHRGTLTLVSGDSHVEVPRLFAHDPALTFDLVTVDGDHSDAGARADLETVLPRVRVGGAVVFDDVSHPAHPSLAHVWRSAVGDRRFATWEFDDVGYGVALAVRRW